MVLVQNEPYVWYQKGGQVMYTLADYIGEDKVNLALAQLPDAVSLRQRERLRSPAHIRTPAQFVAALRAQTPADLQYYITDAFENIVLYDNKARHRHRHARPPDHKYKVTLTVQVRKLKADGSGNRDCHAAERLHRHRRF